MRAPYPVKFAREIATGLALIALVGLAALVLGPATLTAYVSEHLPRMASGAAFSYTENNFDNYAPYSLAWKLAALGIGSGDRHVASMLAWCWGVVALVLTAVASRRRGDRASDAVLWLGILCLATLRSPFAPMYTAIGTLWLLAMATGFARPRLGLRIAIGVAWVLMQGFPPMFGPAINVLLSLPSQLATIAIAVIAVWRQSRTPPVGTPASGGALGAGSE
jgi:hypothetical protein